MFLKLESLEQYLDFIKSTRCLFFKVLDLCDFQSDLPATARVVQERMLNMLKATIKDKAKEDKEKRIVKRSKKVKFFGE